tara:strand:- start:779 stop:2341 length:1563 start_codon:yes stop_codon:yes gene_type:complete
MQEQLDQIIFDNVPIDSIGTRDIFYNNRTSKTTRTKVDEHFQELIFLKLPDEFKIQYMNMTSVEKKSMILEALIKAEQEQEEEDESGSCPRRELAEKLELYIVEDGHSQDHVRVWDREEEHFNRRYAPVKTYLGDKMTKHIPHFMCKEIYDPMVKDNSSQIIWPGDGQEGTAIVNLYKHPSWRLDSLLNIPESSGLESKEDFALPSSARAFFLHLFPEKESRHYVYDYMYHALTSKHGCENILFIHSGTGTGKTLFADNLMRNLVGDSNYRQTSKNLFKSAFNSVLENKRVIYFDEAKVDRDSYKVVKLYANNRMNIEKKGVDADNLTSLFFSLIVSTNKMKDYYLDNDDRRSSIVETTKIKLLSIWSKEEADQFAEDLEKDDFIGEIGDFILARAWTKKPPKGLHQFKGKKFYKFVQYHLSSWQKVVLKAVFLAGKRQETEISLSTILNKIDSSRRGNNSSEIHENTVQEFILDYLHEGEDLLGFVVDGEEEDEKILKINKCFIKDESQTEDEEEEDLL